MRGSCMGVAWCVWAGGGRSVDGISLAFAQTNETALAPRLSLSIFLSAHARARARFISNTSTKSTGRGFFTHTRALPRPHNPLLLTHPSQPLISKTAPSFAFLCFFFCCCLERPGGVRGIAHTTQRGQGRRKGRAACAQSGAHRRGRAPSRPPFFSYLNPHSQKKAHTEMNSTRAPRPVPSLSFSSLTWE